MIKVPFSDFEDEWSEDAPPSHMRKRPYNVAMSLCVVSDLLNDDLGYLHIDGNGNEIPIYEMNDKHLINTIAFHSRNLAQGIKSNSRMMGSASMLSAVMTGKARTEQQIESLRKHIAGGYAIIGRYMVEAVRRGPLIKDAVEACMPYTDALNELASVDAKGNVIAQIEEMNDEEK